MAKRPGWKSSRSERKAGRQRVQRARERGLPEPRLVDHQLVDRQGERARAATSEPGSGDGDAPSSDALGARTSVKSPGIPTVVKVALGALAILLGVYVLSVLRDKPSAGTPLTPEPAGSEAPASAQSDPPPAAEPEHRPERAPPAAAPAAPAAVAASAVPPAKPVVVSPAVAAPAKPQFAVPAKPQVPAPAKAAAPPADNPY